MGGAYAAEKSALEGYLTPRADLGPAYAQEHAWPVDKIAAIQATVDKITTKFAKDLYWDPGSTTSLEFHEMAAARFRN